MNESRPRRRFPWAGVILLAMAAILLVRLYGSGLAKRQEPPGMIFGQQ